MKEINDKNMSVQQKMSEGAINLEKKINLKVDGMWTELEYTMLELEGHIDIIKQNQTKKL